MDKIKNVSVPTKGTHLLYLFNAINNADASLVSVPTKGTHLLYGFSQTNNCEFTVSVPTKGTHLLYHSLSNGAWQALLSFRPHEGDPSSLL